MEVNSYKPLYVKTPLAFSQYLSNVISQPVFMKLENTQPSGSFKLRGISELCREKLNKGCKKFIGSSGGNAGIALAYSAHKLGVPCKIYVPTIISEDMVKKIRAFGAEVVIVGNNLKITIQEALKEVSGNPELGSIHPYDHPTIWKGHSTLIEEIKAELGSVKPGCIVTGVGGGGLLLGILKGLEIIGWKDVPIIAVETEGSHHFNKGINGIESLAAPTLLELYPRYNIISKVVTDKEAVKGSLRFAEDHQYLVEPICGASLAVFYENILLRSLKENGFHLDGPVVVIVCGGSECTPTRLTELSQKFGI